eukprot:342180-Pleurochrysis_carterae.AAC.1
MRTGFAIRRGTGNGCTPKRERRCCRKFHARARAHACARAYKPRRERASRYKVHRLAEDTPNLPVRRLSFIVLYFLSRGQQSALAVQARDDARCVSFRARAIREVC